MYDFDQITLFDYWRQPFKIKGKIRLIELFAGVGSQAMALRNIGADFEHYRVVEFEKHAMDSYNAIHGTNFEPTDITKIHGSDLGIVKTDQYTYLMTYSFPCTDLSVAGRMQGMSKGSGTRSGLLWEVERLLNETVELPQVLVMENVPMVHSEDNMSDFQDWIDYLTSRGYYNYWQDLNAKNYGVAQNRERCFMVSVLGEYYYKFPREIELTKVMKDYLETNVDDKYYITSEKAKDLIDTLIKDGIIPRTEQNRTEQNRTGHALTVRSTNPASETLQTVSRPGTIAEYQIKDQQETWLLSGIGTSSDKYEPDARQTDVACTICARYYKGIANYGDNGVIECQRL